MLEKHTIVIRLNFEKKNYQNAWIIISAKFTDFYNKKNIESVVIFKDSPS